MAVNKEVTGSVTIQYAHGPDGPWSPYPTPIVASGFEQRGFLERLKMSRGNPFAFMNAKFKTAVHYIRLSYDEGSTWTAAFRAEFVQEEEKPNRRKEIERKLGEILVKFYYPK